MSEKALRRKVIKALRALHAVPVENGVLPGTPDVNFIGGWLELKQVDEWPKQGGPLRLPHFTTQQRMWLRRRSRAGGCAFVLLQVKQDYLLFDGEVASTFLGEERKGVLFEHAMMTWQGWPGNVPFRRYIEALTR